MPLDPKLTKFTTTTPIIQTFSYNDIISGLGQVDFYLHATQDDTGAKYSLTSNQPYSSGLVRESIASNNTVTRTFDSTPFNDRRVATGTALLSLGTMRNTGAGANKFTARLYKNTSAISAEVVLTFAAVTDKTIMGFEIPLTADTTFNKGDFLRIVVSATAIGGGTFAGFGHDPQNLDGTNVTPSTDDTITSSRVAVPFVIKKN